MRISFLLLILWSSKLFAQQTEVSVGLSSGVVAPFAGHWETVQFNVENKRVRFFGGLDYARYDNVNIQYIEARKYAAWLTDGFFGLGIKLHSGDLELTPSVAFFSGAGFIKIRKEVDDSNCTGCSDNTPPGNFYSWRINHGVRLGFSAQYPLLPRLKGGLSAVYYPVMIVTNDENGYMAGALQLSLAYTFWREK